MVGPHKGAIAVLNHVASLGFSNTIIKLQCIIHQEVLASKVTHLDISGLMSTVVKIINFVLARGLNHRQFRSLLEEMNAQYQNLVHFCEVRWLSRGAMLQQFYDLRNEIVTFLKQKNASFGIDELGDPDWLTDLVFLTDFTSHINKLNLQLQEKGQFINRMYDCITAFVNKLRLWETQPINSNFAHFPNLGLCKPANSDKYVSVIVSTKTQFETRFCDMKNQKDKFDLFAMPFSVDVNTAPHKMQMEIIELQSSNILKAKYDSIPIANFYKEYVQKSTYPHLFDNAKRVMCMFGSTYCCERFFDISTKLLADSNILASPEAGRGNCLPYV